MPALPSPAPREYFPGFTHGHRRTSDGMIRPVGPAYRSHSRKPQGELRRYAATRLARLAVFVAFLYLWDAWTYAFWF